MIDSHMREWAVRLFFKIEKRTLFFFLFPSLLGFVLNAFLKCWNTQDRSWTPECNNHFMVHSYFILWHNDCQQFSTKRPHERHIIYMRYAMCVIGNTFQYTNLCTNLLQRNYFKEILNLQFSFENLKIDRKIKWKTRYKWL